MTEDAATRLGRLIRERRKSLSLTQADIQAAGGPSTATLRLIEGGKHTDFRPSTSQPLESALQWESGSIATVLDGGEPVVVEGLVAHARATGSGTLTTAARQPQDDDAGELSGWVALSFLADEVDSAIPVMAPDPHDTDEVENYISDVESLVSAAEDLTDSVHKAVLEAFGGDVAKLRQFKRKIQRANSAKHEREQPSILDEPPAQDLSIDVVWPPARELVSTLDALLRPRLDAVSTTEYEASLAEIGTALSTRDGVVDFMADAVSAAGNSGFEADVFAIMREQAPIELRPAARELASHYPNSSNYSSWDELEPGDDQSQIDRREGA